MLGTDGEAPEYILSSMTVTRDGEKIEIPFAIYSDFGELHFRGRSLTILKSSTEFAVRHHGGDGAATFAATFYFEDKRLDRVVVTTLGFVEDGLIGTVEHTREPIAKEDRQPPR